MTLFARVLDPANWEAVRCPSCREEWQRLKGSPHGDVCPDCVARARRSPVTPAQRLARAGVPELFRERYREPAVWPVIAGGDIREWRGAAGQPWSLLFLGETRVGKTWLATYLFSRFLAGGRSGLWITAAELTEAKFRKDGETWDDACNREVLLLDELGRGHEGGAWEIVADVVRRRHQRRLPTLFTTNRKLVSDPQKDRELGLSQEAPSLYGRLAEGAIVPLKRGWR